MFRFESGKCYKSYNGKEVIMIPRRTDKSVWINQDHQDPGEAFPYLKRIKVDSEGNEYIVTKYDIPVFAEFEATKGEFNHFITSKMMKFLGAKN